MILETLVVYADGTQVLEPREYPDPEPKTGADFNAPADGTAFGESDNAEGETAPETDAEN